MTNSRSGFGIFFFFFFLLNIRVGVPCVPLNSALSSKKDLPFCEQKKCDQEYRTNRSEVLLFCEESKIGNENVSLNLNPGQQVQKEVLNCHERQTGKYEPKQGPQGNSNYSFYRKDILNVLNPRRKSHPNSISAELPCYERSKNGQGECAQKKGHGRAISDANIYESLNFNYSNLSYNNLNHNSSFDFNLKLHPENNRLHLCLSLLNNENAKLEKHLAVHPNYTRAGHPNLIKKDRGWKMHKGWSE